MASSMISSLPVVTPAATHMYLNGYINELTSLTALATRCHSRAAWLSHTPDNATLSLPPTKAASKGEAVNNNEGCTFHSSAAPLRWRPRDSRAPINTRRRSHNKFSRFSSLAQWMGIARCAVHTGIENAWPNSESTLIDESHTNEWVCFLQWLNWLTIKFHSFSPEEKRVL